MVTGKRRERNWKWRKIWKDWATEKETTSKRNNDGMKSKTKGRIASLDWFSFLSFSCLLYFSLFLLSAFSSIKLYDKLNPTEARCQRVIVSFHDRELKLRVDVWKIGRERVVLQVYSNLESKYPDNLADRWSGREKWYLKISEGRSRDKPELRWPFFRFSCRPPMIDIDYQKKKIKGVRFGGNVQEDRCKTHSVIWPDEWENRESLGKEQRERERERERREREREREREKRERGEGRWRERERLDGKN